MFEEEGTGSMTLWVLCSHGEKKSHSIDFNGTAFSKPRHCPGGREATPEDLIEALGGFVVPAAEGRNEEPYELGWCAEHQDVARRWPDGSWGCWWESIVEADGHHQPSDFRPLAEAFLTPALDQEAPNG